MSDSKYQHTATAGKPQETQAPVAATALDFVVRPRFGNKFYAHGAGGGSGGQQQQQQQQVLLSSVFAKIDKPASQAEALEHLGIRLTSKSRIKLDLVEHQPGYTNRHQHQNGLIDEQHKCVELHETFTTNYPVLQPIEIKVNYLKDAYIEAETAFCCLLEATSLHGDRYSVPVLGRGSFSFLGEAPGKIASSGGGTAAQREHCISGVSASFLQRAALTLTVLLCLCELPKEVDDRLIDYYRRVDKTFGYGFSPYIDYLVYCCRTGTQHRDTYLKYLCLEWNNSFTQDRMTQALSHFVETRAPTNQFYDEVPTVMTSEELENDREVHFSFKGKAAKASMYIKNASRQREPNCCSFCHVM